MTHGENMNSICHPLTIPTLTHGQVQTSTLILTSAIFDFSMCGHHAKPSWCTMLLHYEQCVHNGINSSEHQQIIDAWHVELANKCKQRWAWMRHNHFDWMWFVQIHAPWQTDHIAMLRCTHLPALNESSTYFKTMPICFTVAKAMSLSMIMALEECRIDSPSCCTNCDYTHVFIKLEFLARMLKTIAIWIEMIALASVAKP